MSPVTLPVTDPWADWPAYEGWCASLHDSRDLMRYRELARAYVVIVLKREW